MDFKVLNKLKKVGFPQYPERLVSYDDGSRDCCHMTMDYLEEEREFGSYCFPDPKKSCNFSREFLESDKGKKSTCYIPSFTELFDDCNEYIRSMEKDERGRWRVEYEIGDDSGGLIADKLVEALAHLWVAIQRYK